MEIKEQFDDQMQTILKIISGAPAEKRDTIITNMVPIVILFASSQRQWVEVEEVSENLNVLKKYLDPENTAILLESMGFVENKGKITLNTTTSQIARRIDYLYDFFKDDLIEPDMQKMLAELDIRLRTGLVLSNNFNMPVSLIEKMKLAKDGDLLTEGTILFVFGRTVFRSTDRIEWRSNELFEKYQLGTYVRIYKKGMSVEVKTEGN